jgi:serine protease DegQ
MSNVLVELSNAMAAAAEKVGASTVMVKARRRIPATGIAYAPDLILTANHVVEREEGITVTLSDGSEVAATVAGRDHGTDLALLRLERSVAKPAETAQDAKVGQLVLALGRPSEAGIEASLGVVSAVGGPVHTRHGAIDKYIRTDTTPFPGFSGGPLVDADGRVVGLNTSGFGHGAAITIPADLAWRVAEQLAQHGSVRRGYLGVRSQGVEDLRGGANGPEAGASHRSGFDRGRKDSPAEAAGLMVGDIIVAIDGQPVRDHDELFARLSGDVIDKSTPVEVLRGGQPQSISVKIGARK